MRKVLIIIALIIFVGAFYYSGKNTIKSFYPEKELALKTFTSYENLVTFLKESRAEGGFGYGGFEKAEMLTAEAAPSMAKADTGTSAEEYSTTNIQVEGVDEADIVKNDGKYIYTVSGNKIVIIDAYPAENAEILSEIDYKGSPIEIFINDDRLVVFGQKQTQVVYTGKGDTSESGDAEIAIAPRPYPSYEQRISIDIYDISDRKEPKLVDEITVRGYYADSRMIDDYVYLVANENIYYYEDRPIPMPVLERDGEEQEVPATKILCPPYPDYSYRYTNILAIDTQNKNKEVTHKVILTGNTQDLYMSTNNLYMVSMKRQNWIDQRRIILEKAIMPLLNKDVANEITNLAKDADYKSWSKIEETLEGYTDTLTPQEESSFNEKMREKVEDVQREWMKESEKTVIHRISINKDKIEYEAEGEVPGRVLNQFSMDEYYNHFRIATTAGWASTRSGEETSVNNVYVLNMDMKIVGKVEDLAPGEKIYSARFMGKRAYMVTFRNIDPLFVIDLTEPTNPKILGKLKIPGYSDYLHPYDEDHIIGLGKWTMDAKDRDFAWYQGLKISLFDVSDVTKPKEIDKYEIGDRGTDSYALHDHKAFLFDKNKNLLVIPVLLAEIDKEKYPQGIEEWQYGDYKFQGAYVFNIDLEKGIELKGRITHVKEDDETFLKSGYYYYNDAYSVKRSLYMDDVLYTVSGKLIKMNRLDNLEEVNKVELPYEVEEPVVKDGLEVIAWET